MEKVSDIQMRKRNMKLFPIYRKLGFDFIFFYTINFLFLTQVKGINPADVVLIDSFYYLFGIIAQIPATIIIEFFGRKNSIILANVLNCIYMVIIIFSKNLFNLIIAEIVCSLAFAIKTSVEPSILSESIPPTKRKSEIFARINQKGISGYYIINAISTVLAGILYEVNPYIPICLSLLVLIILTFMSTFFVEPIAKNKKDKEFEINQTKQIKEAFSFIMNSNRVKSLILFCAFMTGLLSILKSYEISLLEELNIKATYLGIIFAVLGMFSGFSSNRQELFHNKFKNKSLTVLSIGIIGNCIISGVLALIVKHYRVVIIFIIFIYLIKYLCEGIYTSLIEKYLSNFTNEDIDTKIFIANNLFQSVFSAIMGIVASFLLDRMQTTYCMITIGVICTILMLIIYKYMKPRVGLNPEDYPEQEIKYDRIR